MPCRVTDISVSLLFLPQPRQCPFKMLDTFPEFFYQPVINNGILSPEMALFAGMVDKKALKAAYKEIKFKMGVFQIRNTINQKIFIESSVNLDKIWNRHKAQLAFGGHPNTALQLDWKQFGEQHFVFEVLSELSEEESLHRNVNAELKVLEQLFLEQLQPYGERGYHQAV